MYFGNIDAFKFKDDAEPYTVMKMLIWMADGYLHDLRMSGKPMDVDMLREEFDRWMDMFKKLVYKEEYLDGRD